MGFELLGDLFFFKSFLHAIAPYLFYATNISSVFWGSSSGGSNIDSQDLHIYHSRTPYQTFQESKQLAKDKLLETLFQKEEVATISDPYSMPRRVRP